MLNNGARGGPDSNTTLLKYAFFLFDVYENKGNFSTERDDKELQVNFIFTLVQTRQEDKRCMMKNFDDRKPITGRYM
ncbi:unnamed protein product [Amoebophrya sp. A120]|nr:unnamed protein product [Amoebophrya sp. A120]|eukprot:GSA120T00020337001.1